LGDAPTSDNDSPRRAGLSIDELGELSNDQRNKRKTSRLEYLPESKTKISRRTTGKRCNFVTLLTKCEAPTGAIGFNQLKGAYVRFCLLIDR
jgi:hypothetical protein